MRMSDWIKGFWVDLEGVYGGVNRVWVTSEEAYKELASRPTTKSCNKVSK